MWIVTFIDANREIKHRQFMDKSQAEEFCDCMEECGIKFEVKYLKLWKVKK